MDHSSKSFSCLFFHMKILLQSKLIWRPCDQSHYREVPRWEIFMEQKLRFGLDLGRMADFPVFIASIYFELWNHHIYQMKWYNLWHIFSLRDFSIMTLPAIFPLDFVPFAIMLNISRWMTFTRWNWSRCGSTNGSGSRGGCGCRSGCRCGSGCTNSCGSSTPLFLAEST